MPNWCENILVVTGDDTELSKFDKTFKGRPALWSLEEFELGVEDFDVAMAKKAAEWNEMPLQYTFNALYPVPEEILRNGYNGKEENGSLLSGYDWCIENWGTKWDMNSVTQEENPGEIKYYFSTAWGPPLEWCEKVAGDWLQLEFKVLFFEPGMCFAGENHYVGGELVDSYSAESKKEVELFVTARFGYNPFEEYDEDDEQQALSLYFY